MHSKGTEYVRVLPQRQGKVQVRTVLHFKRYSAHFSKSIQLKKKYNLT